MRKMTQPTGRHLAQFNWATLRYPANNPRVAEFIDNVARLNTMAERMPGFVWRHHEDAKALNKYKGPLPFKRDKKRFTTTLSVWEDAESLKRFAFSTVHNRFYKKRGDWFEPHNGPYIVFWWVPKGHRPDIAEAVAKARDMLENGESDATFGWSMFRDIAAE